MSHFDDMDQKEDDDLFRSFARLQSFVECCLYTTPGSSELVYLSPDDFGVDDLRRILTFIDLRLTEEDRERCERIQEQDSKQQQRARVIPFHRSRSAKQNTDVAALPPW
jgi:hypothetical protein